MIIFVAAGCKLPAKAPQQQPPSRTFHKLGGQELLKGIQEFGLFSVHVGAASLETGGSPVPSFLVAVVVKSAGAGTAMLTECTPIHSCLFSMAITVSLVAALQGGALQVYTGRGNGMSFFPTPHQSLKQPLIVTTTFLDPARFLCSQSQIPCQVPRLSFPSVIGTERPAPNRMALICAGMSSGPSQEC